jgi:hypothetical protein
MFKKLIKLSLLFFQTMPMQPDNMAAIVTPVMVRYTTPQQSSAAHHRTVTTIFGLQLPQLLYQFVEL